MVGYYELPIMYIRIGMIFSFIHLSIGISGINVRFINPRQDIQEITNIIKKPGRERYAIIVSDLNNSFADLCIKCGCSLEQNAKEFMSIVNVPSIKGLEFDIVYVIREGMTNNEKYIAYTRALSELIIIETGIEKEVSNEIGRQVP